MRNRVADLRGFVGVPWGPLFHRSDSGMPSCVELGDGRRSANRAGRARVSLGGEGTAERTGRRCFFAVPLVRVESARDEIHDDTPCSATGVAIVRG
jgi:hypothetical protein